MDVSTRRDVHPPSAAKIKPVHLMRYPQPKTKLLCLSASVRVKNSRVMCASRQYLCRVQPSNLCPLFCLNQTLLSAPINLTSLFGTNFCRTNQSASPNYCITFHCANQRLLFTVLVSTASINVSYLLYLFAVRVLRLCLLGPARAAVQEHASRVSKKRRSLEKFGYLLGTRWRCRI